MNILSGAASVAFASLSKQMWKSAEKVATDPGAREQVWKAAQQLQRQIPLIPPIADATKESLVDGFGGVVRIGSVATGAASALFALKAFKGII